MTTRQGRPVYRGYPSPMQSYQPPHYRYHPPARTRPPLPPRHPTLDVPPALLVICQGLLIMFYMHLLVRFNILPYRPVISTAMLVVFMAMGFGVAVKLLFSVKSRYRGEFSYIILVMMLGIFVILLLLYIANVERFKVELTLMLASAVAGAVVLGLVIRFVLYALSTRG